jgi:hypothetical protein
VKGRSFDECIDSIVNDEARLTRLVVFRGKAEYLYHDKFGVSHKWLKDFLKKVESGTVKPSPKLEQPTGKNLTLNVPNVM